MESLGAATSSGAGLLAVVYLAILALDVMAGWRIFEKAGHPGWAIFVPFYNLYVMCKIAGRPGWYMIWLFIPIVNIVVTLLLAVDIARAFERSAGFGVGLWILGFVFIPLLGFGPARYRGSASRSHA